MTITPGDNHRVRAFRCRVVNDDRNLVSNRQTDFNECAWITSRRNSKQQSTFLEKIYVVVIRLVQPTPLDLCRGSNLADVGVAGLETCSEVVEACGKIPDNFP